MVKVKTSGESDKAEIIATLLMEMFHAIQKHGLGDELVIINKSGLTVPQLITLHILRELGPKFVSEVAEVTNLSRAATSHLVERLVKMKLVARTEHQEDRRQKRVTISATGVTLIDKIKRSRQKKIVNALHCLSAKTLQQVRDSLHAALAEIQESRAGQHSPGENPR